MNAPVPSPLHIEPSSPHGSTGASHPAIIRALQVYGKDWGSLSDNEDAFLKALRAADVKMSAELEAAGRLMGFGSRTWERAKGQITIQRDADYASALELFEAAEMESV